MGTWREALAELEKKGGDPDFWDRYLERNPDVLHEMLGDLHKLTRGHEQPTLESLWDMVSPKFTSDPLSTSVRTLLQGTGRSQRWLARELHMDQRTVFSWIDDGGLLHAPRESMRRLEVIARAFGIHPSFFPEWRRLWIVCLLDDAFTANPTLSASLYMKLADHEVRGRPQMI